MTIPNLSILGVEDAAASAAFYEKIIGHAPFESSKTFSIFDLGSGFALGLWGRTSTEYGMEGSGTRSELAFAVNDEASVESMLAEWKKAGIAIAEDLNPAGFGLTFVGLDPDGHRLRVYARPRR